MIQHRAAPPPPPMWAPGPAPAGLHAGPPVQVGPRLLWVGLAWLLFGALVLAGVATFVTGTTGVGGSGGPERFFASGRVTSLELDPAADPHIYVALDDGARVRCRPVGATAGDLHLTPVTEDRSVLVDGREWHAAFALRPTATGTYEIVCEGPGASFAFGDGTTNAAIDGAAAVALLALPLTGLAVATVTTIVVLTRRRAAQDRLFAPWTGGAAWPGPRW